MRAGIDRFAHKPTDALIEIEFLELDRQRVIVTASLAVWGRATLKSPDRKVPCRSFSPVTRPYHARC